MRILLLILILSALLISCSPEPQTPEEWEAQQQEGVQEGFEDFLKEKRQQDEMVAQEELEVAQERPETFEKPKTKLDVEIPADLVSTYGSSLTDCFEGYGSVEKIAAVASWCVSELAADHKDAELCERLLNGEGLDKCYQAVAKESKDASLCEKIQGDATKMSCKGVVS